MTDNSAKIRMAAELLTHNTTESLEGYFEQSKKKILFNLDFYPQVNYQPISRTEYRQFFSDSLSQESMREDLRANQVINQNRERNIIWDAEGLKQGCSGERGKKGPGLCWPISQSRPTRWDCMAP